MELNHVAQREAADDVPIDGNEGSSFRESGSREPQTTTPTKRFGFDGIVHLHPETRAVANMFLEDLRLMAQGD